MYVCVCVYVCVYVCVSCICLSASTYERLTICHPSRAATGPLFVTVAIVTVMIDDAMTPSGDPTLIATLTGPALLLLDQALVDLMLSCGGY